MSFHIESPDPWHAASPEERASGELSSDSCVLTINGETAFYLRGLILIPVLDAPDAFAWGVWSSISERNFVRAGDLWEAEGRESEPPYFGWLATSLPLYPQTRGLKLNVHTTPVGHRPLIVVEPTDHPLAVEQRDGITMDRVREIAEFHLHDR